VGGKLFIDKNTGGDLAATASSINVSKDAIIGGDVLASGGDLILEGTIKGSVKTGVGTLSMNGTIEKGLDCRGNEININGTINGATVLAARYISIGRSAAFMQNVRYWNENGSTDFGESLKKGRAFYDKTLAIDYPSWQFLGYSSFIAFIWYLGTAFIFILLIRLIFPNITAKAGEGLFNNTGRSIGYGALFMIVVPVIIVIAFMTIIGIPVAILMLIGYITLLLLGSILFSVLLAQWVNRGYKKKWGFWKSVWATLGIFILFKLASLTPFVGWLISGVAMCVAFGSILVVLRSGRNINEGIRE
jgi:cytoskeletal protein CcmA (bactofilin family)